MIYPGVPSFSGLGLEDGHIPTFRLLLYPLIKEPPVLWSYIPNMAIYYGHVCSVCVCIYIYIYTYIYTCIYSHIWRTVMCQLSHHPLNASPLGPRPPVPAAIPSVAARAWTCGSPARDFEEAGLLLRNLN